MDMYLSSDIMQMELHEGICRIFDSLTIYSLVAIL